MGTYCSAAHVDVCENARCEVGGRAFTIDDPADTSQ